MSTETKEQGINPIPAEKEGGGDEWTWANRFCYNDLMRAMMAMAGWCSQIRMRDAIHGTEAGNYSDEFIKNTWPERLSPTTEPVPTTHQKELTKEEEFERKFKILDEVKSKFEGPLNTTAAKIPVYTAFSAMDKYAAQEVAKEREKARQAIEHCSELMSMQTAEIERLKDLIEGMWHRKVKSEYHFFNANYVTGQQWQQFKKENNL